MRIIDFISNRSAWNDPELWSRFDGYFGEPGWPAVDVRDTIAVMQKIDIEADIGVGSAEMIELIHRGLKTVSKDFPGLIPDDLVYFLCPMANDNAFVIDRMHGIGGFAARDAVLLYANPCGDWKNTFLDAVIHETSHTARYPFGDPYRSFRDWVIFEGMTEQYLTELRPDRPLSAWVTEASTADLIRLLPTIRSFWDGSEPPGGNIWDWFFGSKEHGVPLWLGYALGYRLVNNHRRRHLATPWSEYIRTSSQAFDKFEMGI